MSTDWSAEEYNNLGVSLHNLNREVEAIAHFTRALSLKPDYANAHANLGLALESLGRREEAIKAFEKAVEYSPTAKFYYFLFHSKKAVAGDPQLERMIELAQRIESLSREQQIHLHFGLGKVFADLEQYDLSFKHLLEGNALKRQEISYNEGAMLRMLDRVREIFTPEFMRSREGVGNPSIQPIFILGMPRSGSTLVEQILASHPRVFGAGEIGSFSQALKKYIQIRITDLTNENLLSIGTEYLHEIKKIAPDAERITDKMPSNFRSAGLIHLALPNARIIHTRRNPIDTCVSCFSVLFFQGNFYSYELGELGRYYRAYQKLMDHWQTVLPEDAMLEVDYEELIADFEGQVRRILAYCDLTWDDACLTFYKTQRPIKSISAPQVYQPLYKTSVDRASCYGDFIQPLRDALGKT